MAAKDKVQSHIANLEARRDSLISERDALRKQIRTVKKRFHAINEELEKISGGLAELNKLKDEV